MKFTNYLCRAGMARYADVLFDAAGALLMILLIRHLTWLRAFPEGRHLSKNEGKSTEIVSSPQRIADFRAE